MHIIIKAACAALLTGTATYAFAHEGHHDQSQQTVIIKDVHGDAAAQAGIAKCKGPPEVDVSDERKEKGGTLKRSRVVICSDGRPGVDVVQRLQNARERVAKQEELSAETRAKALAALDAAIARHQSATN